MMKSFSRQKNIWRLFQGPILHVLIARLWFYSHRAPLYKLAELGGFLYLRACAPTALELILKTNIY